MSFCIRRPPLNISEPSEPYFLRFILCRCTAASYLITSFLSYSVFYDCTSTGLSFSLSPSSFGHVPIGKHYEVVASPCNKVFPSMNILVVRNIEAFFHFLCLPLLPLRSRRCNHQCLIAFCGWPSYLISSCSLYYSCIYDVFTWCLCNSLPLTTQS